MKFIFITREGLDNPGARNRCYYFSNYLINKGFDSEVYSFAEEFGGKLGYDGSSLSAVNKLNRAFRSLRYFSKSGNNSVFLINRFNYHSIPAWLTAIRKRIPVVFDMDDWEAREKIGYRLGFIPRSKAEYLSRLLAKSSVFCIASSKYLANYLRQFNAKVYYMPSGVDTGIFKRGNFREENDFIFSWHGSINRPEIIRYLDFIIGCFLKLQEKYHFIRFFIAGSGIYSKDLTGLIKSIKCDKIKNFGNIEYKDIPVFLDNIDVGLVPLLEKTRFNLAKSPVKLFEYMAKAKPVIASNIGEAGYILQHGYDGFLAKDQEDFISYMERLILDKQLAKRMGDNARNKIEKEYSLAMTANKFFELITSYFDKNKDNK